jgi:type II secretory pathway component PulM
LKKSSPQPNTQSDLIGLAIQKYSLLNPREQWGLKSIAVLLVFWIFWQLLWLPAQHIWFSPSDSISQLELQLQEMKLLQTQAQVIRTQTRISTQEASKAMEKITKSHLPQAQMTLSENTVQIAFTSVSAPVLSRWLSDVRESAQSTIVQADLTRTSNTSQSGKDSVLWQGRLVVGLPH